MKTLLCILSYGGQRDVVFMNWEYLKLSGADILGIDRVDTPHEWPEKIPCACIGKDGFVEDRCNLPSRIVETFRYCLDGSEFNDYTDFCLIEGDSIFLDKLPEHPGGIVVTFAGRCAPHWKVKAPYFLHVPWWADRETARKIVECGEKEVEAGNCENGSPDVWLGYLLDRHHIPYKTMNTVSINGRDSLQGVGVNRLVNGARMGAFYAHGVRTPRVISMLKPYIKSRAT